MAIAEGFELRGFHNLILRVNKLLRTRQRLAGSDTGDFFRNRLKKTESFTFMLLYYYFYRLNLQLLKVFILI